MERLSIVIGRPSSSISKETTLSKLFERKLRSADAELYKKTLFDWILASFGLIILIAFSMNKRAGF